MLLEKKTKVKKTKLQEETQRDTSSKTDRHAIDAVCKEKSKESQFTSHTNRMSDTNDM